MTATVSVIIPCYNAEKHLDAAIRSVRGQSLSDLELLVVDDGSSDRSREIAERHAAADSRVRVLTPGRRGQYAVRNLGVERAGGRWIQYLDADDWLEEDKLRSQVEEARKHGLSGDESVVYGDYRVVRDHGAGKMETIMEVDAWREDEESLLRSMLQWQFRPNAPLWLGACLLSRDVFRDRRFDAKMSGLADTLFLVDLLLDGVRFVHSPGARITYRHHGANLTADEKCARRAYIDYLYALAERDRALVRETRNVPHLLDEALRHGEPYEFRRLASLLKVAGIPEHVKWEPGERTRLEMIRLLGGGAAFATSRAWRRGRRMFRGVMSQLSSSLVGSRPESQSHLG